MSSFLVKARKLQAAKKAKQLADIAEFEAQANASIDISKLPETATIDSLDGELYDVDGNAVDVTDAPLSTPIPSEPTRADLKLDADQLAAVDLGCNEPYCNIVGSAGTGKTSTVMRLIQELANRSVVNTFLDLNRVPPEHTKHNYQSLAIGICAFTGKARDTIIRAVPNEYKPYVYTIHKLLDYGPETIEVSATQDDVEVGRAKFAGQPIEKRVMVPRRDAERPLPFKIIVIDEVSMAGMSLITKLFDAALPDTRFITIGDLAQLTPVLDTPSHPLLINAWPTQELRTIYRQKDGDLIDNANRIRVGQKPEINDNFRAFAIPKHGVEASNWVNTFIEKEYNEGRYDPNQDLLITPQNVGPLGQEILNLKARKFLNPNNPVQSIRTMRGIERFAVGDRVVNRKNDYEIGVTNGMVGTVQEINLNAGMAKFEDTGLLDAERAGQTAFDMEAAVQEMEDEQRLAKLQSKLSSFQLGNTQVSEAKDEEQERGTEKRQASHSVTTQFDYVAEDSPTGAEYNITMGQSSQLNSLQLGWWITVYIAQGSSARNVYVLLHPEHGKALNREMLYTAVTRARENITLLSTTLAVNKSLKQQLIKGDTLEAKVTNYMRKMEQKKDKVDFNIPTTDIYHMRNGTK